MIKRLLINNLITFSIIIISIIFFFYSYFFASVVRTIAEDELIKKGFDPVSYVEEIWYSKIIPTIGKFVVGEREPYEYLIKSIDNFINQDEFRLYIKKLIDKKIISIRKKSSCVEKNKKYYKYNTLHSIRSQL